MGALGGAGSGRDDASSQLSTASTTLAHPLRHRRCRPISFRRAVDRSLAEPDDVAVPAGGGGERRRTAVKSGGFWRGLLTRKKAVLSAEPPLLGAKMDAEATVLAWQRRNEAVAGNRAFSVYIPAQPEDYAAAPPRRNSLTYAEDEVTSKAQLQVAR